MKRLLIILALVIFSFTNVSTAYAERCGYLAIGSGWQTCDAGYRCPISQSTATPVPPESEECVLITAPASFGGGGVGNADATGGGNSDATGGGHSDATGQSRGFLVNPLGDDTTTLNELLAKILNVIVQIGVVVLTMMLVYCGFLFVTAQGNPENISKARSALIWTIIGGFLVLGAEVIAEAIKSTAEAL